MNGARNRSHIAWALGVSALLHVWLAHNPQGLISAPRVVANSGAPLTVEIGRPSVDYLAPEVMPRFESAQPQAVAPQLPRDSAVAAPKARVTAAAGEQPPWNLGLSVAAAAQSQAALPRPSDPTYYGALSLDVYPKAITSLDLGAKLNTAVAGQVRATVLIDEAGVVNEVRAIDAAVPDIANAARELLLQTRFTPARKDERAVKAEVRVSLDYGPR